MTSNSSRHVSLRVFHVTQYCHAGSIGGTERYVLELIQRLEKAGHANVIVWLTHGQRRGNLVSESIRIERFPAGAMRVDLPPTGFSKSAAEFLAAEKPHLVHFHTFGLSEAAVARQCSKMGIPYLFTYHSPGWTCRRGDLLRWSTVPCDGEVHMLRCSACMLHKHLRTPAFISYALALASMPAGWLLRRRRTSKHRRRIAFVYDSSRFRVSLKHFLQHSSLNIACSDWSISVLTRNGAASDRVSLCPQGTPEEFFGAHTRDIHIGASNCGTFVVGYVGRCTLVKGIDILVEGFHRLAAPEARLKIFGWVEDPSTSALARKIRRIVDADPRIKLVGKLPMNQMIRAYSQLHMVAIPSIWFETGPLVLFEALQLGIPVYASDRIGQIELLQERGRVVEPNTPGGWHRALEMALQIYRTGQWEQEQRRALGPGRLRSMADVAAEMDVCYRALWGRDKIAKYD